MPLAFHVAVLSMMLVFNVIEPIVQPSRGIRVAIAVDCVQADWFDPLLFYSLRFQHKQLPNESF